MGFFTRNTKSKINWQPLNQEEQLTELVKLSKQRPIAIFKHSTRCALSSMAKSRLERGWDIEGENIGMYYLDLIRYRDISNKIASLFSIEHQSPQLILLTNGEVNYHVSHGDISPDDLKSMLKK